MERSRTRERLTPGDVRELALRYLGRREHSCFELTRKLTQRGAENSIAEQVVEVLSAEGFVSDQRFAEEYARYRFGRLFGPRKIAAELKSRGVASEFISEALAKYDHRWDESLAAWIEKRLPKDWTQREKARLYRSGRGRGFTHDQVMSAIDRAQELG